MDVLRHIGVQLGERLSVGLVAAPTGNFGILNAAELVVLLPEIRLEDLKSSQKSEDCCVTLR